MSLLYLNMVHFCALQSSCPAFWAEHGAVPKSNGGGNAHVCQTRLNGWGVTDDGRRATDDNDGWGVNRRRFHGN